MVNKQLEDVLVKQQHEEVKGSGGRVENSNWSDGVSKWQRVAIKGDGHISGAVSSEVGGSCARLKGSAGV